MNAQQVVCGELQLVHASGLLRRCNDVRDLAVGCVGRSLGFLAERPYEDVHRVAAVLPHQRDVISILRQIRRIRRHDPAILFERVQLCAFDGAPGDGCLM